MGLGSVNKTESAVIGTRSALLPLANQSTLLNNEILDAAYAVGWLGQPYPPFMTSDYALLPFYLEKDDSQSQQQTNWTATTTQLSTELPCWMAQYQRKTPTDIFNWYFQNGQGCNTTISINGALSQNYRSNITMEYFGYYPRIEGMNFENQLLGPGCPARGNNTHQFLAVWASQQWTNDTSITPTVNLTGIFCQPYYFKQQVMVSVATDGFTPLNQSVRPIAPREPLTEKEFNSTAFEFLIANGRPATAIPQDFPFANAMVQNARMLNLNLTTGVSNLVGFALAGSDAPITSYQDPRALQAAFSRAHKYLFSLAVNQLLVNDTNVANTTAVTDFQQSGIIVSRIFSAVVEGLLLLVAIFTVSLWWCCHTSPSYLTTNPSSIARLVAIFRNGPETNELFRTADHADEKSLRELFQNDKFRLARGDDGSANGVCIEKVHVPEDGQSDRTFDKPTGYYEPIRPKPLRWEIGLMFGLIQVAAVVGLVYLKVQNDREQGQLELHFAPPPSFRSLTMRAGLIRPSNNFEVLQILENYIPTAFATFSEPFWVLLNRFLCLLQPFKVLSKGKGEASKSIDTTYTAIPPQLAVWRALKARHLMLAMLCVIALLSNLLAVGLGALFNEAQTAASYNAVFTPNIAARFDNQSVFDFQLFLGNLIIATPFSSSNYQDPFYTVMANISSGTPLLPWTSPDYFFQPHTVDSGGKSNSSSTYVVSTQGFGINANCTAIQPVKLANMTLPDVGHPCSAMDSFVENAPRPSGQAAIEYCDTSSSITIDRIGGVQREFNSSTCGTAIAWGWGRSPGNSTKEDIEGSFAFCLPYIETATFNVRHDAEGYVLAYERTSNITAYTDHDDQANEPMFEMIAYMNYLIDEGELTWHNDTLTSDWMNYLLAISLPSRDFLDPTKPAPDPNTLIPTLEKVYRQVFAVLLSLNQQLFAPADTSVSVQGQKLTNETRIFMDRNAFIITMTVLGLDIIAVIIFYSRGIIFNLPRIPTTIGSVLAYVSASHMLVDEEPSSPGEEEGAEKKTYSFGRYIGVDQKVHLGIDSDPHVALIHPKSLREKKSLLRRVTMEGVRRRKEFEPVRNGPWL